MKKVIIPVLAGLAIATGASAQDLPKPSPKAELEQVIGLSEVEIEYSRPGAKGREVWGGLVPYGQLWRTGANKNTTIEFSTDATVAGKEVKAGKYALFLEISESNATIHLNTEIEGWGTGKFADSNDVLVSEVKLAEVESNIETMLFYFDNVKSGSADLILAWSTKHITIPIEVDFITQSLKNIEEAIAKDGENFRVYENAASFYLENNLDAKKALGYAETSVKLDSRFWNVKTLSEAYAANGKFDKAIEHAKKSMTMSQEADYQPYVKMNKDNISKWSSK